MAETTLQEIHEDLELLKQDVARLTSALLGEGELTDSVKARVMNYLKEGTTGVATQEEAEKEFA